VRGFPSADDAVSPGVFVPEWDDRRIAVGNGDAESQRSSSSTPPAWGPIDPVGDITPGSP
jgi:hypothetical protein